MVREFGQPYTGPFGLTHVFPEPRKLGNAKLTAIGLPKPQGEAIQALARAVSDCRITFDRCGGTAVLIKQLSEIPGFANVEAQYIAMRAWGARRFSLRIS
jgi:3-methyladenine DNA glycosylase/8-oxoguanine DNA glycosylase